MTSVFIGRQPLLNRKLQTVGYELLFRDAGDADRARVVDGDAATARVLIDAVTEFGLDHLVGNKLAFVNLTERYLVNHELVEFLPTDRVVLEVLEQVTPSAEVLAGIRHLVGAGYTVALDDFADFDGAHPTARRDADELLALARIVKYELGVVDPVRLRDRIALDHAAGRQVVVERIETHEQCEMALDAGADFVQGYFFAKPTTEQASSITPSALVLVRLIARINDPAATVADIVEVLSQDVSMSVKVLRFVNSAAFGLQSDVRSIQQAAVLVGLDVLRSWTNLALMAASGDRPFELVQLALTRARFCERVARQRGLRGPSTFYTVGLLSLLDVMTGVQMDELVSQLALDGEVREALLGGAGPLAEILAIAIELEQGTTDVSASVGGADVYDAHREAVAWAHRLTSSATTI